MGKELVPIDILALAEVESVIAGQIAKSSQEQYKRDLRAFAKWIRETNRIIEEMTFDDMVEYRAHLIQVYAKTTASRMLTVAKLAMKEAYRRGTIGRDITDGLRGLKLSNESPRTALTIAQCETMIGAIDRATPKGKRDYALLLLLIRNGLRRAEIVSLQVEHLGMSQGYYILTIPHGKGDKRRVAKLQTPVWMAIQDYLLSRGDVTPDAYLFVGIDKTGHWRSAPLHMYGGLNYIITERAKAIGIHLTPHDLRATFITLALDGGAALHKVQYAAGHADPRTTERYHRRKDNLADNATDYIHVGE